MPEQLINTVKAEVGSQITGETSLPSGTIDKVFSVIGVAKGLLGGLFKKG